MKKECRLILKQCAGYGKPSTPPEDSLPPKPLSEVPTMVVPPPDGLKRLVKFPTLDRMHLMDLFVLADKDKSWSTSREELLNAATSVIHQ
ncbi:hypothetical protein RRG08_047692 [Elysia crispata]|uniref:Uncharacterized protein n=1 Tax=Elysia crispata TaxID=231223 RepID=A0AAE1EBP7_9GAST|nr:hypothetical protein RRG08_047692 [Elysia crispata]